MAKKTAIDLIARILVIVGALNLGLGIWDINLVTIVFSAGTLLIKIVYALVGLAGIWELIKLFK